MAKRKRASTTSLKQEPPLAPVNTIRAIVRVTDDAGHSHKATFYWSENGGKLGSCFEFGVKIRRRGKALDDLIEILLDEQFNLQKSLRFFTGVRRFGIVFYTDKPKLLSDAPTRDEDGHELQPFHYAQYFEDGFRSIAETTFNEYRELIILLDRFAKGEAISAEDVYVTFLEVQDSDLRTSPPPSKEEAKIRSRGGIFHHAAFIH